MAIVRTLIGNVKGVKGDTGATGAQGNAGEITIGSVTTGSYGTPASVVNSGTATNAVLDFTIPQGAPGETVTDASPLTASTITTSTAQYPTYTAGETLAVILGKISKFFSDIRTNGLFKGNLVNGFTQTTPGENALDAAAGKTLNDSISSLNTSLENYALKTDLENTVTGMFVYNYTVGASASKTFNVEGLARFMMFMTSSNNASHSLFVCASSSNGAVSITDIKHGSNVTFDTATAGKLKISNAGSAALIVGIIEVGGHKRITE